MRISSGPALTAAQVGEPVSGIDAFRVDLSQVTNRYIGETEKHLDAVFGRAERSGAALQFDEGDALLGKRTEVKDSHDRFANPDAAPAQRPIEPDPGQTLLQRINALLRHHPDG